MSLGAMTPKFNPKGASSAIIAACLFGLSAPASKLLLDKISPIFLAGLLYLGAGLGLLAYRLIKKAPSIRLEKKDRLSLVGAVTVGGIVSPIFLLLGISKMPATGASLLLNLETVFTALIAWQIFKEHIDRRIAFGMSIIVAGAILLTGSNSISIGKNLWAPLFIIIACAGWALDNNWTRKVCYAEASWLVMIKGLVAGSTNIGLALAVGSHIPKISIIFSGLFLGLFSYGFSLGTARAGAYFTIAPFLGAIGGLLIGEPFNFTILISGILMAIGLWLHLTEDHKHDHIHKDENEIHSHNHFPDLEHRHSH
jgi:drug/metabolite transporter (DMT)-like permease